MTLLHDRIMSAAYPLFLGTGIQDISTEQLMRVAGVTSEEFYQAFPTRSDLNVECLAKKEYDQTFGGLESGCRAGGHTAQLQLLALFDVLDEWFRRTDHEAFTFVSIIIASTLPGPPSYARAEYQTSMRKFMWSLVVEAQLLNPDAFMLSLRVLLRGAINAAAQGDEGAPGRARAMAHDLLAHHLPLARRNAAPEEACEISPVPDTWPHEAHDPNAEIYFDIDLSLDIDLGLGLGLGLECDSAPRCDSDASPRECNDSLGASSAFDSELFGTEGEGPFWNY